jgi:succinoglycan biosynthesis transport protein ExoP
MSVEIGKLELKGIIRRRKKMFLISSMLIFFVCTVVALVLPPIYKSEVMIVVENQEIPDEYVKSTITTFVSERLQLLTKRILSYQKLLEIIKAHNLYPDFDSEGAMVTKMQEDIELQTIDVSLRDRQTRGSGVATVAFTLTYYHKSPESAKNVADILANLFVQEDLESRRKQASTTTKFLEKELEDLRRVVKLNEEKISRFKAANINQLPGSTTVFSQTVFRLEQDIDNINSRIRTIQEKIVYLKSQIANIDPLIPILTEDGEVASNPSNRLKYLRLQLIQKQSILSERHPDIIRLKSEIQELEAQVGQKDTTAERRNRLAVVERDLAELKAKYGDKHPDVVRMSREADLLNRQIGAAQQTKAVDEEQSDNPGYMNIRAQIIVAESELEGLRAERIKAKRKLEDYQLRLESAPFIDEEYNSLTLDYQNAKAKFNEVSNKLHSARIAQEMDTSESGERFRIDYPANLPDKPDKPKRLLIILMGLVLGMGCGVLLAALVEGLDASVKAADELESIAGIPVLAAVSFFDSPKQKRERRLKKLLIIASGVVIFIIMSLLINWFVMPMRELWAKAEDRLIEVGFPIEQDDSLK